MAKQCYNMQPTLQIIISFGFMAVEVVAILTWLEPVAPMNTSFMNPKYTLSIMVICFNNLLISKWVFTMQFGSIFGDFDMKDSFLKAPLAYGSGLTCVWYVYIFLLLL